MLGKKIAMFYWYVFRSFYSDQKKIWLNVPNFILYYKIFLKLSTLDPLLLDGKYLLVWKVCIFNNACLIFSLNRLYEYTMAKLRNTWVSQLWERFFYNSTIFFLKNDARTSEMLSKPFFIIGKKSLFFVWSLPKKVGSSPSSDRRILKMSISGQLQWKNSNMALLDIYVAKFMVHQKWKKVVEIITFMINGGHPNKKIHLYFVRCNNLCT